MKVTAFWKTPGYVDQHLCGLLCSLVGRRAEEPGIRASVSLQLRYQRVLSSTALGATVRSSWQISIPCDCRPEDGILP